MQIKIKVLNYEGKPVYWQILIDRKANNNVSHMMNINHK